MATFSKPVHGSGDLVDSRVVGSVPFPAGLKGGVECPYCKSALVKTILRNPTADEYDPDLFCESCENSW